MNFGNIFKNNPNDFLLFLILLMRKIYNKEIILKNINQRY